MACSIVYRVPWAIKVFEKISKAGACDRGGCLGWNFTFDNRFVVLIDYFICREMKEKRFLPLESHWHWVTQIIYQERKCLVRNFGECSKDFFRWAAWTLMRRSCLISFLMFEFWWVVEYFSFSSFPPHLGKLNGSQMVFALALARRWNQLSISLIPAHSITCALSPGLALQSCI